MEQPPTTKLLPVNHRRTAFIAVNGILTNPGDSEGWCDRFVTWINCRLPDGVVAEKFEYACGAITRMWGQRARSDAVGKKIGFYRRAGYRVVLVAHSNGCAMVANVLKDQGTEIEAVHLFSPAAFDADYEDAILDGAVSRIHIYGSKNDAALKFASATSMFFKWTGLTYGSLGLRGAEFAARFPEFVRDHSNDLYGHSTWFQRGAIFEKTMRLIEANDAADQKPLLP